MKKIIVSVFFSALFILCSGKIAHATSIFDGGAYWGSTSDSIGGAIANITYNSKPKTYNSSASCAWTMICDSTSNSFAQVGWAVDTSVNSDNVYYFFGYQNYIEKQYFFCHQ